MTKAASIRIGVGGWTFEPWRGVFFPDDLPHKRELEYASRHLTSIEINGTYYGTQKPATFEKWHDETPDDFVFSVKGPRYATNRRVLAESGESINRFLDSGLLALKDKLGVLLWQFMPTKQFDPGDFEAFLKLLPKSWKGHELRHAVEVRHESFGTEAFVTLARAHEVAIVLAGDSVHPLIADASAAFVYARIMGTKDTVKSGYSAKALDEWAVRAKAWAEGKADGLTPVAKPLKAKARPVFLYVISGAKVRNPAAAMALIERVGGRQA